MREYHKISEIDRARVWRWLGPYSEKGKLNKVIKFSFIIFSHRKYN